MPRRWGARDTGLPAVAAAMGSIIANVAGVLGNDLGAGGFLAEGAFLAAFPTGLLIGLISRPRLGIGLTVATAASAELGEGYLNPFVLVLYGGAWMVGYLLRARRLVADQLTLRAQELEGEREMFAQESVRYERARIARELHDIVAHCVSVMVVQASAGNRLVTANPALAAESFAHIAEAAQQAQQEMSRLLVLLDNTTPAGPAGLGLVDELVERARATGLPVTCRFSGNTDRLPPPSVETAYRLVQEALTNALKHAPGAAVLIDVVGGHTAVEITVSNEAPAHPPNWLHRTGGGNGLRGMRERAAACGGHVDIGPRPDGGWKVSLALPV